ncbi:MAG TPA: Gfo/Idh/MocA family oxidoreductase [Pirellulales bacterium]|jgi:predicted dehydrogenase|nr:Gfo/Idh/MocA family oxidoreductase [Pirellulales bacterium]
MTSSNRREFLQHTALGIAGAAAASSVADAAETKGPAAANERTVIGLIGPGGMGTNHLKQFVTYKDVQVAYVCDPDAARLAAAAKLVESATGTAPKAVTDMRQVLDDKAVDAVVIATPDHWHAPATILACQAGKHVYVEKPCSHNIREGRLMIEAARKYNRVVQVGTQSRSNPLVEQAMQRLREGAIGEILSAKVWNSQRRRTIGHTQPSEPPTGLDYDTWVGPAPLRPYQSNLLPGIWRWWYEFGCGDMGNDGVHNIDIACWGLGVDTHPTSIAAIGGKYYFDDDQQFPDTQTVIFEYPGDGRVGHKKQLIFEQRIWSPYVQEGYENGNAFYGTKGYLVMGHTVGWQLFGERNKLIDSMTGKPNLPAHHRNFLDCISSGARPHADVEIGHLAASLCHLGNIATRVGRVLTFDPVREKIVGDEQANALVRRQYRDHWGTPANV